MYKSELNWKMLCFFSIPVRLYEIYKMTSAFQEENGKVTRIIRIGTRKSQVRTWHDAFFVCVIWLTPSWPHICEAVDFTPAQLCWFELIYTQQKSRFSDKKKNYFHFELCKANSSVAWFHSSVSDAWFQSLMKWEDWVYNLWYFAHSWYCRQSQNLK